MNTLTKPFLTIMSSMLLLMLLIASSGMAFAQEVTPYGELPCAYTFGRPSAEWTRESLTTAAFHGKNYVSASWTWELPEMECGNVYMRDTDRMVLTLRSGGEDMSNATVVIRGGDGDLRCELITNTATRVTAMCQSVDDKADLLLSDEGDDTYVEDTIPRATISIVAELDNSGCNNNNWFAMSGGQGNVNRGSFYSLGGYFHRC